MQCLLNTQSITCHRFERQFLIIFVNKASGWLPVTSTLPSTTAALFSAAKVPTLV